MRTSVKKLPRGMLRKNIALMIAWAVVIWNSSQQLKRNMMRPHYELVSRINSLSPIHRLVEEFVFVFSFFDKPLKALSTYNKSYE